MAGVGHSQIGQHIVYGKTVLSQETRAKGTAAGGPEAAAAGLLRLIAAGAGGKVACHAGEQSEKLAGAQNGGHSCCRYNSGRSGHVTGSQLTKISALRLLVGGDRSGQKGGGGAAMPFSPLQCDVSLPCTQPGVTVGDSRQEYMASPKEKRFLYFSFS